MSEIKEYKEKCRDSESQEYYYPNLIKRLKDKGLRISDLAKYLNRDYYQVSRKVNGIGQFNMTDCKKVCKFLEMPFEEVFKTNYTELKQLDGVCKMTNKERDELKEANYLVNIKGDLLFLLSEEQKLQNAKTRKERHERENNLDERAGKLARHIVLFYSLYSDATYKVATLRELRWEILLWFREGGYFEDYVFNLLQSFFNLTRETFEDLKEVESEPSYEFNFRRIGKEV